MSRRRVTMQYYREPEGWWAASEDLPGFSAAGDTFEEVAKQAHSGAEFFAEELLEIIDVLPDVPSETPVVSVCPSPLLPAVSGLHAAGVVTHAVTNYSFFGAASARPQDMPVRGAEVGSSA